MLERERNFDEALLQYRAAILAKPGFRQAYFQRGRLLLMLKRPREAVADLEQTITPEDAETPRFLYALGVAYTECGDHANAARCFRDAGRKAATLGQDRLAAESAAALRKVAEGAAR